MTYYKHNDYEIISQIREGNNEALELLFEKYKPLISKKIYKFNLYYDYDDMYQESLMVLFKSLERFDEKYSKTFTRYFEQNLERKFITIVTKRVRRSEIFRKNEKYIFENNHNTVHHSEYFDLVKKEITKILTNTENLVYTLRELNNYSISYIHDTYGLADKVIYNSLHRAKKKIRKHFET
ncbi:MAG: RNA polymerase sigma-H factor [Candidatus Izimaplasma bacterium HR2]|nr:MAG: RNA polymerase sigma-H factor [Candidatus Izimaplasma bacterium HR2]